MGSVNVSQYSETSRDSQVTGRHIVLVIVASEATCLLLQSSNITWDGILKYYGGFDRFDRRRSDGLTGVAIHLDSVSSLDAEIARICRTGG
jgi:hypothetical protein